MYNNRENKNHKILRNFEVQTDYFIHVTRQYLIVVNKRGHQIWQVAYSSGQREIDKILVPYPEGEKGIF